MKPRTQKRGRLTGKGEDKDYPFYRCTNYDNKYNACTSLMTIRTQPLDDIVWQECCLLFKRLDVLQARLQDEMKAAVSALLEDTAGQEQILELEQTIAFAESERQKHKEGSYMHNLLSKDIAEQKERLTRYKEELESGTAAQAINAYQQRIMSFLDFLNVMRGSYHEATFQQKRNALDVLGVRVVVSEPIEAYGLSDVQSFPESKEWYTAKEAGKALGVHAKTIQRYFQNGIITRAQVNPHLLIHREEILKLHERGFRQRNTEEIVRQRIQITYSPRLNLQPAQLLENQQKFGSPCTRADT